MGWYDDPTSWERMTPFIFRPRVLREAPAEVDRLLRLVDPPDGARVLDLACGVGRHSVELARRGFRVVGVDLSEPYLEEARRLAREAGVSLDLRQGDMRAFRDPDVFDLALSLYTSFGYFDDPKDDQRVLANVRESLAPGGTFVVDVMGREVLKRVFDPRSVIEEDGIEFTEVRRVAADWSRIDVSVRIQRPDAPPTEVDFGLRLYSADDLADALGRAGFGQVDVYGGLDGSPYDEDARRLVAVAHAAR